jgi:hypothetical protein
MKTIGLCILLTAVLAPPAFADDQDDGRDVG